jgi:hypothetical protein
MFKGFCQKTEQAKIRSDHRKLFRLILQQTNGDVKTARQILQDRPYAQYIPGIGTVLHSSPDFDNSELQNIKV